MLWRFPSGSFLLLALTLGSVASAIAQPANRASRQPDAGLTLGSVATAIAQPPDLPVSPKERSALAAAYTTERLHVWQKRLNLAEWSISVVVARATELKPKTLGNIHWDLDKKTAVIRVLDPLDYKLPYPEMLQDMEFTVVHELIHLEFAPVVSELQRSDANRREEEHAVNHMADALLRLDRVK